MLRTLAAIALILAAATVRAEPPRVVADIPPVHGLVARVMQGVGAPLLLLPPDATPHGYAMRPSEARRLAGADLVFWTGPALTPWLDHSIEALAPKARSVPLLAAPGTRLLPFREGALFDAHDHGADGDGDHDSDAHDADAGHADPHAWLDPANAAAWTAAIAGELAAADPANAAAYRRNAAAAVAEIDALAADIARRLAPLTGRPYVVLHDAYQYFENRFALGAAGAIQLGDAGRVGASRVARLRALARATPNLCVFAEPQIDAHALRTVTEGTDARAGVLDPVGAGIAPGPGHYRALMEGLAASLAACLGD